MVWTIGKSVIIKVVPVVGLLFAFGCTPGPSSKTPQAVKDAEKAVAEAGDQVKNTYQDFRRDMSKELNAIDQSIERLQKKASTSSADVAQSIQDRIHRLQQKKNQIEVDLESLSNAATEQYNKLRAKIETSYEALKEEVNQTF